MATKTIAERVLLFLLAFTCGCTPLAVNPRKPRLQRPDQRWSARMADSIMQRNPDPATIENTPGKWSYSASFAVYAIATLGEHLGEKRYVQYGRRYADPFLGPDGKIVTPTYKPADAKLDDVAPGRLLLLLHRQTNDARYLDAAHELTDLLRQQPRTSDGGFWHKRIYPHQMWLDGIYMACPFMVEYAHVTGDASWFDEAVHQITTIAKHTRDPKTGLYYHGWDESRSQHWADPQTGLSPNFWGRSVGWYVMGIVETLEHLPADHPRRGEVVEILQGLVEAIARVQDPQTGLWYQVLDQHGRERNYLESSAACMFVLAIAKGVRLGHLDEQQLAIARRAYDGIVDRFIEEDPETGAITLTDTCQVAGLGGPQKRDGSFDYYVSEPRVSDDPKGTAPFILASLEMERLGPPSDRPRQTARVDCPLQPPRL